MIPYENANTYLNTHRNIDRICFSRGVEYTVMEAR